MKPFINKSSECPLLVINAIRKHAKSAKSCIIYWYYVVCNLFEWNVSFLFITCLYCHYCAIPAMTVLVRSFCITMQLVYSNYYYFTFYELAIPIQSTLLFTQRRQLFKEFKPSCQPLPRNGNQNIYIYTVSLKNISIIVAPECLYDCAISISEIRPRVI